VKLYRGTMQGTDGEVG